MRGEISTRLPPDRVADDDDGDDEEDSPGGSKFAPPPKPGELIAATKAVEEDRVRELLELGANVAETDGQLGRSALFWAASIGSIHIIGLLYSAGADLEQSDKQGETPLVAAAMNGRSAVCYRLLQLGANPTAKTLAGETALDHARRRGKAECVAVLEAVTMAAQ
jgi:ankyrin repeat protein